MLTYRGVLKVKNNTVKVSEKFQKREFVLTDNAQSYPQTIQFQLTQDRCSLLDASKVGDDITVTFLLKGREWKNPQGEIKFFNSLDVFRIDQHTTKNTASQEPSFNNETLVPTPDDDLPF
jgi:hypothetical protein